MNEQKNTITKSQNPESIFDMDRSGIRKESVKRMLVLFKKTFSDLSP